MNNSSHLSKGRMSRRQPTQKRGKERVEKILLAAADVFLAIGYSAATTQQIAERAKAAIGSIYQFFPDKLAIFHALEEAHYQKVEGMNQVVLEADIHRPLSELIDELINGYGAFLSDPISRCVIFQLSQPHVPGLFAIFDPEGEQSLEQRSIAIFADLYQQRNPTLSRQKSELLSEVAHNTYRGVCFMAFKSQDADRQNLLFAELKELLYGYLEPHLGDRFINLSG
jgi:AcrR family transcriptional regulator